MCVYHFWINDEWVCKEQTNFFVCLWKINCLVRREATAMNLIVVKNVLCLRCHSLVRCQRDSRDRIHILIKAICVHRPWRLLAFLFFFSFFCPCYFSNQKCVTPSFWIICHNFSDDFIPRGWWLEFEIRRVSARRTLPVINYYFYFRC